MLLSCHVIQRGINVLGRERPGTFFMQIFTPKNLLKMAHLQTLTDRQTDQLKVRTKLQSVQLDSIKKRVNVSADYLLLNNKKLSTDNCLQILKDNFQRNCHIFNDWFSTGLNQCQKPKGIVKMNIKISPNCDRFYIHNIYT